jgi:hypothetical protein
MAGGHGSGFNGATECSIVKLTDPIWENTNGAVVISSFPVPENDRVAKPFQKSQSFDGICNANPVFPLNLMALSNTVVKFTLIGQAIVVELNVNDVI